MQNLTFVDTLLVAVVGILVVFFGLVVLILLINLMGALTGNMGKKAEKASAPAAAPVAAVAAPVAAVVAPLVTPDTKVKPAKVDAQTVAVLTAAIAATRGEGYPFKIRRIVRVNKAN
ncbi:MAG: OadG family protein [Clostridia bacterium]|nr:OadG family protein [Clostridia bacterium]